MVTQCTPEQFEPIGATDGAIPIDIRPTAGFNGWKLGDEARGGHIPGAISFPFAWSVGSYDSELVDRLAAKGLTPAQNLIIYGTDDQESLDLGWRLETLGFDGISYLVGGNRPGRPMEAGSCDGCPAIEGSCIRPGSMA